MKRDRLAFDRGTVRRIDPDGRMHVEVSNISKATVNPYNGSEIPGCEDLGLDPEGVYLMLRHPDELAKGAPTFNNLPLLSQHVPVSADEPMKDLVVGSVGSDVTFDAPYLKASLCVWDSVAIAAIESGEQKEISCAYHYVPDMTPGVFEGEQFDGIMRDIIGNHVALVEMGRAGPDVVVGDSQLSSELSAMKLSRKAIALRGALKAYLRPKLAQDGAIHLNDIVRSVKAQTLNKAAVIKAVEQRFTPKLAKDANLADLGVLIDTFAGDDAEEMDDVEMDGLADPGKEIIDPENTNIKGINEDGSGVLEFLKDKLSEEDLAKVREMMAGAKDSAEEDAPPKTEQTPPPPSKGAMDAAISLAAKQAEQKAIERMRAIREAEKAVAPFIGEVVAMDSAEAVYKMALDHAGVDLKGVEPSAYKHLVRLLPRPDARRAVTADAANDQAQFEALFPGAKLPMKGI